jgi:hypothetical protein
MLRTAAYFKVKPEQNQNINTRLWCLGSKFCENFLPHVVGKNDHYVGDEVPLFNQFAGTALGK